MLCVLAVADGMLLLSLSKSGLDMLMRLCSCSLLVLMRPSLRTIDIKGNGD